MGQVIYERLAVRDATFCKPSRATEFASMGAADFVRNLLLGSYRCEVDAIDMYKQHWLPVEQAAAAASTRSRSSNIAKFLEDMLNAFLNVQPEKPACAASRPRQTVVVGGQLYPRFRQWLTAALAADDSTEPGEGDTAALERKTTALLQRLQAFAVEHLARADATSARPEPVATGPGAPFGGGKWRCTRCAFPNDASCIQCTACCLTRKSDRPTAPLCFAARLAPSIPPRCTSRAIVC